MSENKKQIKEIETSELISFLDNLGNDLRYEKITLEIQKELIRRKKSEAYAEDFENV